MCEQVFENFTFDIRTLLGEFYAIDFVDNLLQDVGIDNQKEDIAASFQQAVIDVLLNKTQIALHQYAPKSLIIAGGVAANHILAKKFTDIFRDYLHVYISPLKLSVDNAAMIGSYAYFNNHPLDMDSIQADPNYHARIIGTSRHIKLS